MNQKVIVITGTSSGVGRAMAEFLSQKNYTVYGLSRKLVENAGFHSISTDVTIKASIEKAIDFIVKKEQKIDFLINNAGRGMVGAIEDATEAEIMELFRLNLIACTFMYQAVLPIFRQQGRGRIINISSIGSEMGLPYRGYYSASKAALDKTTEALRYEIAGFGMDACVLHLGDVETPIAQHRITTQVSEAYAPIYEKVFEGMNAHVEQGVKAEKVAEFVVKLLEKKSVKPHYYFGKFNQKLSIILKKFLPQRMFEGLIRKYSHL